MSNETAIRLGATEDTGQVLPLVAVGLVLVVGMVVLVVTVGQVVDERARARTAADAAALAGAASGSAAAEQVAVENGAVLEEYEAVGSDVLVRVSVGRARADARAVSTRSIEGYSGDGG